MKIESFMHEAMPDLIFTCAMTHKKIALSTLRDSRFHPSVAYINLYSNTDNLNSFPPFAPKDAPASFLCYRTLQEIVGYQPLKLVEAGQSDSTFVAVHRRKDTKSLFSQTRQMDTGVYLRCPKCFGLEPGFLIPNEEISKIFDSLFSEDFYLTPAGKIEMELGQILSLWKHETRDMIVASFIRRVSI